MENSLADIRKRMGRTGFWTQEVLEKQKAQSYLSEMPKRLPRAEFHPRDPSVGLPRAGIANQQSIWQDIGKEVRDFAIYTAQKATNPLRDTKYELRNLEDTYNLLNSPAGSAVGVKVGAWVGGAIGALFGGAGAVPGAIIGSFVGGWLFGEVGEFVGEKIIEENREYFGD